MTMDAITIQILRNKIASLVDEMHYHFYRSGYSTIIRESRDFSCVILDRDGRLIVAPPMFFHAPVYRHLVGRILEVYGTSRRDRAKATCSSPTIPTRAACRMSPTWPSSRRCSPTARSSPSRARSRTRPTSAARCRARPRPTPPRCIHEGLLLPPVKIWEAGEPQPDIERIILTNSRQPALMRGDIHAQIAVTQMGAARVKELCGRFGAGTVTDAFAAILKGAADELARRHREAAGRHVVGGGLPRQRRRRGRQADQARRHHHDQGRHRAASISPTAIRRPRGRSICGPSMVEACVFYALIGSLGPNLHFNDGMRDVVRLTFAPRTITNAEPPAPVSSYQMVNLLLVDVILEALAHFNPAPRDRAFGRFERAQHRLEQAAARASPTCNTRSRARPMAAACGHDGATATATHLSNLHTTPIEILESEFPCRITRFDLVPDSGGAGQWRGGLAMRREYELLEDATVIRRFNKTRFPPKGVAGGKDGSRARFVVRLGTPQEFETPASARVEMQAGERFLLQSAGGGGYGDPGKRDQRGARARYRRRLCLARCGEERLRPGAVAETPAPYACAAWFG